VYIHVRNPSPEDASRMGTVPIPTNREGERCGMQEGEGAGEDIDSEGITKRDVDSLPLSLHIDKFQEERY
jgi:hypothetical protein